jgi:hypothetical protein
MIDTMHKGTAGVWAGQHRTLTGRFGRAVQTVGQAFRTLHRIQWSRPWDGR